MMSNNLRLILLIIGCCLVLAVYLWEIYRRNKKNNKADILKAADDIPDLPTAQVNDFTDEDYNKAIADLSELSAQLKNENLDTEQQFKENKVPQQIAVNENKDILDNILVFYVIASANTEFKGTEIKKVFNDIGMIYGDMNIFHYYGKEEVMYPELREIENNNPFFSAANMHEPGIFPLDEINNIRIKGLALFMYDTKSIYSYKIFENIFFNNVQRIAENLDGKITTSNHEILSDEALASIRDKLRQYAMEDFLKTDPK